MKVFIGDVDGHEVFTDEMEGPTVFIDESRV